MARISLILACIVTLSGSVSALATSVMVEALLPNTAVITIDGTRKTLRAGQSYHGVTLISANAKAAVVEVDGERQTLGLHQRVNATFKPPEQRRVDIPRNSLLQYRTTATINGRNMSVIVDTGANVVALNEGQAKTLGVDYLAGQPARMETASGHANAWMVKLQSVDVGGIRVDNVEALVAEGDFPSTILLGVTYLRHVEIQEVNGVLSLTREW